MDVAGAVVFLASTAASLITGDTILIDGGWSLCSECGAQIARWLRERGG